MWTRDTGLLQALPAHRTELANTTTLGTLGSGEGGSAGEERGGAGNATGTGTELGTCCARHPRRWPDTDCERQCNGARNRTCAKECHRPGHRTSEAAVE
jgi:hypothetical protein